MPSLEAVGTEELFREIRRRQAALCVQGDSESSEDFDARREKEEAVYDEWIGTLAYKGNSVSWTHSKAERYGNDLLTAWDALNAIGVKADGNTHISSAIRSLPLPQERRDTPAPIDADKMFNDKTMETNIGRWPED